jgi:hypothetical protein
MTGHSIFIPANQIAVAINFKYGKFNCGQETRAMTNSNCGSEDDRKLGDILHHHGYLPPRLGVHHAFEDVY